MKKRELEILQSVYQNQSVSFMELMEKFQISKRTLYYDLKSINDEIKKYGELKKIRNRIIYIGEEEILNAYQLNENFIEEREHRFLFLSDLLFFDIFTTIDDAADMLQVSKSTVVYDLENIKSQLAEHHIRLVYDKKYHLVGKEKNIRHYFLQLMQMDEKLLDYTDQRIFSINEKAKLHLTDYSISSVSKYLKFVEVRLKNHHTLENELPLYAENELEYYPIVEKYLGFPNDSETKYFTAYLASLSNLQNDAIRQSVNQYVDLLIQKFEQLSAVTIEDKSTFQADLARHLQSSYYRIKFDFPSYNPSLHEIQSKYGYLFNLVREAVQSIDHTFFYKMRETELGFVTMYFGAKLNTFSFSSNKIVIVCPNGLMVSRVLEAQLYKYFPTIDIIGIVSIHDLKYMEGKYDYIISTVHLENYQNVLVVKPILSRHNIKMLSDKLAHRNPFVDEKTIDSILTIIKENATGLHEEKMKNDLIHFFIHQKLPKKKEQPMLGELLTRDRMRALPKVDTWQDAIYEASKVLLEDGSIEQSYVDRMIASVEKFGPYIVLEDGFALPHADRTEGVNKLSMSLLSLKEPVDVLGKMVYVFVVLATIDDNSHLKALSSLSEILGTDENMKIMLSGNFDAMIRLIKQYDQL